MDAERLQHGNATAEIGLDGLFCAAAILSRRCLLRVKLGLSAMSAQCPVCPKADAQRGARRLGHLPDSYAVSRRLSNIPTTNTPITDTTRTMVVALVMLNSVQNIGQPP